MAPLFFYVCLDKLFCSKVCAGTASLWVYKGAVSCGCREAPMHTETTDSPLSIGFTVACDHMLDINYLCNTA